MTNYLIHQKSDVKDLMGLHKYGFVAFPGSYQAPGVALSSKTGKYVTGLDENAPEVLTIKDAGARKKKQEELIQKRTELEEKLGQPGILDARNAKFWDTFLVPIEVDETGKATIDGAVNFDPVNNPSHEIMLIAAKANKMFAFSKEDAYSPSHRDDKFYFTTEEEQTKGERLSNKVKRERSVEMSKLFDGETQDYQKAWEVSYYLGLKPRVNCGVDKLETELELATTIGDKLEKFLKACKMDKEELLINNLFTKAIALNKIKMHPIDKVWYRGGVNYRNSVEESIEYLRTPAMLTELAQITEEVRKAEKTRQNIA